MLARRNRNADNHGRRADLLFLILPSFLHSQPPLDALSSSALVTSQRHVHRLSLSLGWLPPSATRDTAFYHLDLRIPPHLKYGLHSLLVRHGRGCVKCSANGVTSMDHVESCPIRGLVNSKGRKGKGKKVKKEEEEVEVEIGEEHEGKVKVEEKVVTKSPSGRTTRTTRATKVLPVLDYAEHTSSSSSEQEEEEEEDIKPKKKSTPSKRKTPVKKKEVKGSVAGDEMSMSGIASGSTPKKLPAGAMHGLDDD